jgi:RimJ/RimL family protein N-acetyltransferase
MIYRIVPIAKEHVAGFHTAVDSVEKEHRYLSMLEAPPLDEVRKFVAGNIRIGAPQFVAIADETVVGWCDAVPKARKTLQHSAVLGMGVIEAYRRQGIGKTLLEATLQAAKAKGLTRIELTVRVDNNAARQLYAAFGFVSEGLCRRYSCIKGQYTDCYLMALLPEAA